MSIKSEPQESMKGGDHGEGENNGPSVRDQFTTDMEQLDVDLNALLKDELKDNASLRTSVTGEDCNGYKRIITKIVNPLQYALPKHKEYIQKCMPSEVNVLFVGMNPAPFAPSGIPFGDEEMVEELFQINVSKNELDGIPPFLLEAPYVDGDVTKECESGVRFWTFIKRHFKEDMDKFRSHCFVMNCSPLFFIGSAPNERQNISLEKIEYSEDPLVKSLVEKSLQALEKVVELMKPKLIVSVGKFAEKRVRALKCIEESDIKVKCIRHPAAGLYDGMDVDEWIRTAEQSLGDIIHTTIGKA